MCRGSRTGDLTAMFDEVNSLPADDPLRQPANAAAMAANLQADQIADQRARDDAARRAASGSRNLSALPEKVLAVFHANGNTTSVMPAANAPVAARAEVQRPPVSRDAVLVDSGIQVAVPQFLGAPLRAVVEDAGRVGLRVQTVGSGLAREQAPAAGTMVSSGTEVVVRFAR